MPHLLIAGTTGSGKSVCINSLIISILYKARPDEVKFILIDPKKVELNPYNGIPHLLVPVVSDPKKAAGSLHWAVTEMERRYELIEGAGVRNLKGYNKSIENDPDAERLPLIIIVIDELADLMMMAKDDVEDSIIRIAQKARAAGIPPHHWYTAPVSRRHHRSHQSQRPVKNRLHDNVAGRLKNHHRHRGSRKTDR